MGIARRLVKGMLPDRVIGQIDYHFRPNIGELWGGPFNGQWNRQQIAFKLLKTFQPSAIVETGTCRGATTLFFAMNSQAPVYSTEASSRFRAFAALRLRKWPQVTIVRQDSRSFLKTLNLPKGGPVFFYLDAHWAGDLPLREEVEIIAERFPDFLIMIDDFEVPGDPGYGFDDYGPGSMLALRDFPFHEDRRLSVFFPTCRSEEESGSRRGCVVLAVQSFAARFGEIGALRHHDQRQQPVPNHLDKRLVR